MLNLKRADFFDPNQYQRFFMTSPATILAKKQYCLGNGVKNEKYLSLVKYDWYSFLKYFDSKIQKNKMKKLKETLIKDYKKRFDAWMKIYRKFAADFYERRGRRLIQKI